MEPVFSPGIAASRLIDFFIPALPYCRSLPHPDRSEREMLQLMTRGASNAELARLLSSSTKTVANHVSSILHKLRVADRKEVIIRAREAGLGHGRE